MLHNLKRLLDKAISETNAQYDSANIVSRIDVKIVTVKNFFEYAQRLKLK